MKESRAAYTSRRSSITPEGGLVHMEQESPPCIAILPATNWHTQVDDVVAQPQRGQRLDRVSGQVYGQAPVGWASQPFQHHGGDVMLTHGAGHPQTGDPATRDQDWTIHHGHPTRSS